MNRALWQLGQRKESYRSLSIDELMEKAIYLIEEGRLRLSSVAEIGAFSRGTSFGNVAITFASPGMGGMAAEQDREEAERRKIEREVAGVFIHQQVIEAATLVQVLIEKGEGHLELALEVAQATRPDIEKSGPALMEMGKLLVG